MPKTRFENNHHHEWLQPRLTSQNGAPLAWCRKCGMFSPFPRNEPCGMLAVWAYAPEHAANSVPLRVDAVLRELVETARKADILRDALDNAAGE